MLSLSALTLVLAQQTAPVDPDLLPIGRPGTLVADFGLTDLQRNRKASVADVVKAAEGQTFVFLGEQHTQADHHKLQAQVIDALAASGKTVIVGFEMFTRPNQPNLNAWTLGKETVDQFVVNSDWKNQWGFKFELYEPIFQVIRERRLPMVALNIPRPWVSAVGKGGLDALTAEQKADLPKVRLDNASHKSIFTALMGGHPPTNMANIYSAQCLWDEGMADTAIKYLSARYGSVENTPANTVFVIVAGAGHGMYEQGINWRLKTRTGKECVTVTMLESDGPAKVARGLGDFVYVAKTPAKAPQ